MIKPDPIRARLDEIGQRADIWDSRAGTAYAAQLADEVPQLVAALRTVLDFADELIGIHAEIVADARHECPPAVVFSMATRDLAIDNRETYRARIAAALNPQERNDD